MADPGEAARRIAVVTGAGTGVGAAVVEELFEDGWAVVLAGRRPGRLIEVAQRLDPEGDATLVVVTDVTDEAQVANLFAAAVDRFGRVDLLFNNAGSGAPAVLLAELELSDWRGVVDVNLTGVFLCLREAFRVMGDQVPQGGRIINNGSISAVVPRPNSAPYTATKHAVSGLTKSAALDGRALNIAVGQIDIGNAASALTDQFSAGVLQPDGRRIPEPVMDVRHAAEAVAHMASLPLDANVLFMTVMATTMPFVGRG